MVSNLLLAPIDENLIHPTTTATWGRPRCGVSSSRFVIGILFFIIPLEKVESRPEGE